MMIGICLEKSIKMDVVRRIFSEYAGLLVRDSHKPKGYMADRQFLKDFFFIIKLRHHQKEEKEYHEC